MMVLVYSVLMIWMLIFAGLAFLPLLIERSQRRTGQEGVPIAWPSRTQGSVPESRAEREAAA